MRNVKRKKNIIYNKVIIVINFAEINTRKIFFNKPLAKRITVKLS